MLHYAKIELGAPLLRGELCTVAASRGLVVFVHADGGGRSGWRSGTLAQRLHRRSLSTLIFDLISPQEAEQPAPRHDIALLTQRLLQALDALPAAQRAQPLGLFATDTGTAAALTVAAQRPQSVRAIVARGGRPDLAAEVLGDVRAATLLLVGALDNEWLEFNRQAFARLRCEKSIETVPRATRLFLEAGALDAVAHRAGEWFGTHLAVD